ncbi:NAD(P)-binding protein [Flagelloscypha sp. PMI_526]|nr:NAD(P)-binding protein [Flagelloscypha sp. PMI_526]
MTSIPKSTKALVLRTVPDRKPLFHDAVIEDKPIEPLQEGEILVKVNAVAFNHRDLWMRKGLYPGITDGATYGADGAGVVVDAADPSDPLLNKRVILAPIRGWTEDPYAPEDIMIALGGSPVQGTFQHYLVVERDWVVPTPEHLDDRQAAAWPLGGLTAWRAAVINGRVTNGSNVLITGIGGGVALLALQICVAKGANVFVTSSNPEKIQKAVELGAKGGANYKDKNWAAEIGELVRTKGSSHHLDTVIDAGGGPIFTSIGKYLKQGGSVVCYGMHANPSISMTMKQVMSNQRLIGSTMGSLLDLKNATTFVAESKLVPALSHILHGLDKAHEGFELMASGEQFGKIVISLDDSSTSRL